MTMRSNPPRRLPAEWEPSEAVMIAWPHMDTDWADMLPEVTDTYVNIARAILSSGVRLVIVAPDISLPKSYLDAYDDPKQPIIYCEIPTNDTWARDFGPITVQPAEEGADMLPLDFTFNGWGMKFAADKDNLITSAAAARHLFCTSPESHREFVLEGGSIESDGQGTIMTTSECLLSPNRNPWMSRERITDYLKQSLGADRVLWVDHGYLAGDDTDSHIDTLARLAPHDTIVYVAPPEDQDDEHYASLAAMEEQLKTFRTASGQPYNLIGLPMADARHDDAGDRLPATYANYLVVNDHILMPSYGSPRKDRLAAQMMQVAYPEHEVVQIDCNALIKQHGSLHCVTMQLPVGTLAVI